MTRAIQRKIQRTGAALVLALIGLGTAFLLAGIFVWLCKVGLL